VNKSREFERSPEEVKFSRQYLRKDLSNCQSNVNLDFDESEYDNFKIEKPDIM